MEDLWYAGPAAHLWPFATCVDQLLHHLLSQVLVSVDIDPEDSNTMHYCEHKCSRINLLRDTVIDFMTL